MRTETVVLSGGEPLLNPEWASIAEALRESGHEVWLLTSGLSLAKHARRAAELFQSITVSLDGTDAATYRAIRGLDAFDKVCEGIRAAADQGVPPGIRVTLQRANYRQLPAFVDLAKKLGARSVSFLAVDVANAHAFGRTGVFALDTALEPEDLPDFEQVLRCTERDHLEDFRSGFIEESTQKLRRIHQYFAAVRGEAAYPAVRCNAPEFSAVITAAGRVQPCFFIEGPPDARLTRAVAARVADAPGALVNVLNRVDVAALRTQIRAGARAECKTCVCTLWRDPGSIDGPIRHARPIPEAAA
jgi:MoaA/NifB/PqqE/SkfB family radical SAM enzyme